MYQILPGDYSRGEDKNMEKIKKCPFCGGKATLNSNYSHKARAYFVFVKCDVCGGQGKIYYNQDDPSENDWNDTPCNDAVNAWNMRTD